MSEMQGGEFKPVIVEVAEIGKQVVKLTFESQADWDAWWTDRTPYALPLYGGEVLGPDF